MKPTSPTSTELYSPPGPGFHRACPWLGYLMPSSSRKMLQGSMSKSNKGGVLLSGDHIDHKADHWHSCHPGCPARYTDSTSGTCREDRVVWRMRCGRRMRCGMRMRGVPTPRVPFPSHYPLSPFLILCAHISIYFVSYLCCFSVGQIHEWFCCGQMLPRIRPRCKREALFDRHSQRGQLSERDTVPLRRYVRSFFIR